MTIETVEVPFQSDKLGRQYLTLQQLSEQPELVDFINRFPHCFFDDFKANVFWFNRNGWRHDG